MALDLDFGMRAEHESLRPRNSRRAGVARASDPRANENPDPPKNDPPYPSLGPQHDSTCFPMRDACCDRGIWYGIPLFGEIFSG